MSRDVAEIVVVDDTPANLQLLVKMLRDEGYKVRPVTSGAAALELARTIKPDLMLLDINMPGMNGYEVCRRIKADDQLRDVPVIFLSAMHETFDKVQAFEVGGQDYIAKPFQTEEARARIQAHLHLARLREDLKESNRKLKENEEMRTRLAHMLVHDMRTPLFSITGMLELSAMCESVARDAQAADNIRHARDAARLLIEMISSILDVYKMESNTPLVRLETVEIGEVAAEAIRVLGGLATRHHFTYHPAPRPIHVRCDRALTGRVILNLVSNAIKFTPPAAAVELWIDDPPGADAIRVRVTDQGPGIAPESQSRLFQLFGQVETRSMGYKYSSGLGLVFCKMVVEAQGGAIGLESEVGKGSTFWFTVPKSLSENP